MPETSALSRQSIFPEENFPELQDLLQEGQARSRSVTVGACPFLVEKGVASESVYKRKRAAAGQVMLHAQIGYRSPEKSVHACRHIHERITAAGYSVDRYGICLDWSMGYPAAQRAGMPQGTGLLLGSASEFAELASAAPVAPHFGDFVMGTPAAYENTQMALQAGSTAIGNIGQYFNFRMPNWDDDVYTTTETVKAIALCAAQPTNILIHSNLDDGFAALFCDLASAIGAAMIEHYIIDELIGGTVSHCYGHTFCDPLTRMAFQRALASVSDSPGTMVYGNTTIYTEDEIGNYAGLASYLLPDIVAQTSKGSGHALNPVPVTEAVRIPDVEEVIDAHLFANRLVERAQGFDQLVRFDEVDATSERLIAGGRRFKDSVINGLGDAGVDTNNAFEMLLAIRRVGGKRIEELFGPGEPDKKEFRGRKPVVKATTVAELERQAERIVAALPHEKRLAIENAGFRACVGSTDVHEYGKQLLESALGQVGVEIVDAGVSTDPDTVAKRAAETQSDCIAISTYNGIALQYVEVLQDELSNAGLDVPIYIGGRMNQIEEDSETSLPADVTQELSQYCVVCYHIEDMLISLADRTL